MEHSAIRVAVKKAGGQRALAQLLGVSQQAVCYWVAQNRAPAERVLHIERVTGVPRTALRPDIYPAESAA